MSIGAINNNATLYSQVQSTSSLATNTMESAMNGPQQFLELLETSISVKNSVQLAQGLGINVDTNA